MFVMTGIVAAPQTATDQVAQNGSTTQSHHQQTGTPALTTRGLKESDIEKVVDYIHRALTLGQEISKISGPKLADFNKCIEESAEYKAKINILKEEVEIYSQKFPLPGFETY